MSFKKTILFFFIFIFIFSGFSFVNAQPQIFTRDIGAGRISSCNCTSQEEGLICNCLCQSVNSVEKCQVGWLINDPICACCGDCTLQNFLDLGVNVANQILKYLGVAALFLLVIGGLIWITSGGSSEKVQKGKKIVSGAVIGLIIVLFSFFLVRLMMKALGTEQYLPSATTEESSGWPICPELKTVSASQPWCYGCSWTGSGQGCQSSQVKNYQETLNHLRCNCGTADGVFGSQTAQCTIRFQQANKLEADGKVGPATATVYLGGSHRPCQ